MAAKATTGTAWPAAILILAVVLAVLLALPFIVAEWVIYTATIALAKGLVVLGLVFLLRMGLVSFGHGLYYAIGAYVCGTGSSLLGISEATLLVVAATIVTAGVSGIVGLLLCGYRGVFFAMFNLALSMVLYGALLKSVSLGGSDGISVTPPSYLGFAPTAEGRLLAVYVFVAVIASAVGVLAWLFSRSALGLVLSSLRDNEIRLEYLGVSVRRLVLLGYVLSAALAGLGGALVALASGHIIPEMAYWTTSGEFVFVTVLSGPGSVIGAFIGTGIFEAVRLSTAQYFPNAWQLFLGSFLLIVILFLPDGISSLLTRRKPLAVDDGGTPDPVKGKTR